MTLRPARRHRGLYTDHTPEAQDNRRIIELTEMFPAKPRRSSGSRTHAGLTVSAIAATAGPPRPRKSRTRSRCPIGARRAGRTSASAPAPCCKARVSRYASGCSRPERHLPQGRGPGGNVQGLAAALAVYFERRMARIGKEAVVGVKDRATNRVSAHHVHSTDSLTVANVVAANAKFGATLFTDDASAYDMLDPYYDHEAVNHSAPRSGHGGHRVVLEHVEAGLPGHLPQDEPQAPGALHQRVLGPAQRREAASTRWRS